MWTEARPLAERLRALPIEVLQSAFWSVDPERVVAKYAGLADRDSADPTIGRFVALEDWANSGEPLPLAAAAELIDELFTADRAPWAVPGVPTLHFTATGDRIVPAETAAPGERRAVPAGHVGMIVGRSAPEHLHAPLRQWIDRL
jgi:polyhydroxyalkanoate synthase